MAQTGKPSAVTPINLGQSVVAFGLLMFWIMFWGIRKLGLEGWLLLPPVVLHGAIGWQASSPSSTSPDDFPLSGYP